MQDGRWGGIAVGGWECVSWLFMGLLREASCALLESEWEVSLACCRLGVCPVHVGLEFGQNSLTGDAVHVAVRGQEREHTKVPWNTQKYSYHPMTQHMWILSLESCTTATSVAIFKVNCCWSYRDRRHQTNPHRELLTLDCQWVELCVYALASWLELVLLYVTWSMVAQREAVSTALTAAVNCLGQSRVSAAVKASVLHSKITANWNCSDDVEVAVQDTCFPICCGGGNTGPWRVIWKWNSSRRNEHSSEDNTCNLYCPTYCTKAIKSRKMWDVQSMYCAVGRCEMCRACTVL